MQRLKALEPKFQSLASEGGPRAGEAQSYVNSISNAIAEVQTRAQNKIADKEFQLTVQKYQQALTANDKNALAGIRSDFQSITQRGGPHADEARKYANDIGAKLDALNVPPPLAPVTPPVKSSETVTSAPPDNDAAVRAVVMRKRSKDGMRTHCGKFGRIWGDATHVTNPRLSWQAPFG